MPRFSDFLRAAVMGALVLAGSSIATQPAFAQFQGHNFKGDFGVNAGTQPPPGVFVAIPFAQWNADAIKNADGDPFLAAQFEMHSNKKDQDLKVGNLLTIEGGAAYNVPKIAGAFGVGYFLQNKVSDDSGADVPVTLLRVLNLHGRNRLFGIGPDVTMGLFQRGAAAGLLNVRYLWESAGKSSFEGSTFVVAFTVARLRQ